MLIQFDRQCTSKTSMASLPDMVLLSQKVLRLRLSWRADAGLVNRKGTLFGRSAPIFMFLIRRFAHSTALIGSRKSWQRLSPLLLNERPNRLRLLLWSSGGCICFGRFAPGMEIMILGQ